MLVTLFILFILQAAEGTFHGNSTNLEENYYKVQITGAYNEMVRWTEVSPTNPMTDIIIIHIIGGDYHHLTYYWSDILEAEERYRKIVESTEIGVSMKMQSKAKFFSLVVTIVELFGNSETKTGTCSSWIYSDKRLPDQNKFLKYIENQENEFKTAYLVIKKYVNFDDTKLDSKIRLRAQTKKRKLTAALNETQQLIAEYLMRNWTGVADYVCKSDQLDFMALVAFEDHLLEYIDNDDCDLGQWKEIIDLSFVFALHILDKGISVHEELINTVIENSASTQSLSDQSKQTKVLTNNPLGLLAGDLVQNIISRNVIMKNCENCNCKDQYLTLQLQQALERIRGILPPNIMECKHYDDWHKMRAKENIMGHIKDVPEIDVIFEVFSTTMHWSYAKPYIGIPFSEMPVKNALWWIASHMLTFEKCEQFYDVQHLRVLLEEEAFNLYYMPDRYALPHCGILPSVNVDDSLMMTSIRKEMYLYDTLRNANSDALSNIVGTPGVQVTPIRYEGLLGERFNAFRRRKLSLNPQNYNKLVEDLFMDIWMGDEFNSNMKNFVLLHEQRVNTVLDSCNSCAMMYIIGAISQYDMISFMNYAEDRIYPFSYEQDRYQDSRNKTILRDKRALSRCPEYETNLSNWFLTYSYVFTTRFMEIPGVWETYLSYMDLESDVIVPKSEWMKNKTNNEISEHDVPAFGTVLNNLINERGKIHCKIPFYKLQQ